MMLQPYAKYIFGVSVNIDEEMFWWIAHKMEWEHVPCYDLAVIHVVPLKL